MPQYTITVIVGSLRRESINRKFADALIKLAPADFTFRHAMIGDLPLYNQDDDANQADSVKRFKKEIETAQGVLFVTPEYNRSIPGVLKNAIDHASRPGGQNSWNGKPVGIIGVSPGGGGTVSAQQHLRSIVTAVGMPVLPAEAYVQAKDGLIDAAGNIGEASLKFMQGWMDKYIAWVKLNAK